MNTKSIAEQLSLISTIMSHAKYCPEISHPADEWNPSPEMIMQAAALLEKIPHVLDVEASMLRGAVADCR